MWKIIGVFFSTASLIATLAIATNTKLLSQQQQSISEREDQNKIRLDNVKYVREWSAKSADYFSERPFTGLDLENAVLKGINIPHSNFNSADLKGTQLDNADLSNSDLSNADLSPSFEFTNVEPNILQKLNPFTDLKQKNTLKQVSSLKGTNLRETKLDKTNMENTVLDSTFFTGTRIENTSFKCPYIENAFFGFSEFGDEDIFKEINMEPLSSMYDYERNKTKYYNETFSSVKFDLADIRFMTIENAKWYSLSFINTALGSLWIENSTLGNAFFVLSPIRNTMPTNMIMDHSTLKNSIFRKSDLNFSFDNDKNLKSNNININNNTFSDMKISFSLMTLTKDNEIKVYFENNVLKNVNLSEANLNIIKSWKGTVYDENTKFPKNFNPEQHGLKKVDLSKTIAIEIPQYNTRAKECQTIVDE